MSRDVTPFWSTLTLLRTLPVPDNVPNDPREFRSIDPAQRHRPASLEVSTLALTLEIEEVSEPSATTRTAKSRGVSRASYSRPRAPAVAGGGEPRGCTGAGHIRGEKNGGCDHWLYLDCSPKHLQSRWCLRVWAERRRFARQSQVSESKTACGKLRRKTCVSSVFPITAANLARSKNTKWLSGSSVGPRHRADCGAASTASET